MNLHRASESHLATGASGGGTRPGTSGPKDGTPSKASPPPDTGDAPAAAPGRTPEPARAPATTAPARETPPRPTRTPPRPPSPPGPPAGPRQAAPAPSAPPATHDGAPARHDPAPEQDRTGAVDVERLVRRMDRAVSGFVDDPRRAVREADAVLDAAAALVEQRRKELRQRWDGDGTADTEELRLALARYRDLTRGLISLTATS